jgi:hypothetical protein
MGENIRERYYGFFNERKNASVLEWVQSLSSAEGCTEKFYGDLLNIVEYVLGINQHCRGYETAVTRQRDPIGGGMDTEKKRVNFEFGLALTSLSDASLNNLRRALLTLLPVNDNVAEG